VSKSVPMVQSPLLDRFPHGFTTREGGASTGTLASLNLALREHETRDALGENWSRVLSSVGFEGGIERVAILDQVHEGTVVVVDEPRGVFDTVAAADGAITTARDVILAVRTADCVPILFAAPGGVGVAHAGWRGVAASVGPTTLEMLCELTGDVASDVVAVVGPHISSESYEVGDEVVDGIIASGVPHREFVSRRRKAHVSLFAAVKYQLERAGVGQVACAGGCTFQETRFFSHRREGARTGRLASVIARPPLGSR